MSFKEDFRRRVDASFRWGALQYQCLHITDGSHFSPPATSDGLPYVTVQDVRDGAIDLTGCKRISKEDFKTLERNGCRPRHGDVLLTKDGSIGRAAVVSIAEPFVVLSSLGIVRPDRRRIDARFLRYYLESAPGVQQMEGAVHGAALTRLTIIKIKHLDTVVPALGTQEAIANYLDAKTAAIDALIEKKRKLLDLLAEERAALINQAVTKGLDPTVPMKDSGIPWIGEVPVHWEVPLLRLVARIESGHTPSRQHPEYWVRDECVIPWFSLADVWQLRDGRGKYLGDTNESISELGMANSAARLLPKGTVVLSRTASVGFSGIMPRPMATTQDFVNWICGPRVTPDHLLWLFRAMKPEFERLMMGSTHQTIYMPDVRQFRGPLPPIAEQKTIAAFLDQESVRFGEAADKIGTQSDRLQEYRQALITAAVTGQLDIETAA